jgi:hypothetical protein
VLGIRASYVLEKCSTTELHLQPNLVIFDWTLNIVMEILFSVVLGHFLEKVDSLVSCF